MKEMKIRYLETTFLKKNDQQKPADIYLTHPYAKLYEEKEEGEAIVFDYASPHGKIQHTFIKRKVPYLIKDKQYFDITSPYGYGGPVIQESGNLDLLLKDYFAAFSDYCRKEAIVSEFVRFHLFENQVIREQFNGEVQLIGPHIVRDLEKPLEEDLHKGVPQAVRRARRLGLEVLFDSEGYYLDEFLHIYNVTMDFHEATEFYYFSPSFFEKIHKNLVGNFFYVHAMLEGKMIASRLVFFGETYAYYFLGGALREYSTYKAAILLDYEIIKLLQKMGKRYYIFGGGYHGEDNLLKYKTKFALNGQIPFYIGKKVHIPTIYQELAEIRSREGSFDPHTSFFPSYRS